MNLKPRCSLVNCRRKRSRTPALWIRRTRRGTEPGPPKNTGSPLQEQKFGVVAAGKCCDILGEHKLLQRSTVEWRGKTRAVKPDDERYRQLPRDRGAGLQADLRGGRAAAAVRPRRSVRCPVPTGCFTPGVVVGNLRHQVLSAVEFI